MFRYEPCFPDLIRNASGYDSGTIACKSQLKHEVKTEKKLVRRSHPSPCRCTLVKMSLPREYTSVNYFCGIIVGDFIFTFLLYRILVLKISFVNVTSLTFPRTFRLLNLRTQTL